MKKMINQETIIGRIYEHSLAMKTVQNKNSKNFGKNFLNGTLSIAVDEDGMSIIQVRYSYVTERTKAGDVNRTYRNLNKILNEGKTWITDGKDAATKVKLSPSIGLNDFFPEGSDESVSQQINDGGFVELIDELPPENERAKFKVDMLITGTNFVEADPEKETEAYLRLRGAVFNFRGDILPLSLIVRNPEGINYFESRDISPQMPLFTCVWGKVRSFTEKKPMETETAFGEKCITYQERKIKELCVTGTNIEPYEYGEESVLTEAMVTEAMQQREIKLATEKKRTDEWRAQRDKETNTPTPTSGGFMNGPAGMFIPDGNFKF